MGNDSNIEDEQYIKKKYNLDSLNNIIAKGKYSNIYKTKTENNELAIKIINKNKILEIINIINQEVLENTIQERLKIMKYCGENSDYSIKIINSLNTNTNYYFVMEYCNISLKEYFIKNKKGKGLDIDTIRDIFTKLNKLLTFMANNKIYHGDIKPEHILISIKEGILIPKLADFFNFNLLIKNYSLYTAPEIINNKNSNYKYDIKTDLWSIGLILYELYYNEFPFKSIKDIINLNKNNFLKLSKEEKEKDFNDLIENLLKIDIHERISFDEYIGHAFWVTKNKINEPNKESKTKKVINESDNHNEVINKKEIDFEFKTENYKKELDKFTKNDLKEIEIFKYSGFSSKKTVLKDEYIMKWLSKLSFSNLKRIDLNGNDFENIEGLGKMELYMLTELNLNSNKIDNITELTKVKFENLTSLDLSENQISNIDSLSKTNFEYLSILNLSENKINNISILGNCQFYYLTILNLGFNQINNIDIFSKVCFNNLIVLYLNNNQIENINVFTSIPFEKLEILNLNSNNIKEIGCLKNSKLKMIKELNLSFNKIEEIKNLNSFPFANLESLNLSFNKISNINCFENMKFKSIKKISLYGNDDINYDSIFVKDIIEDLTEKKINIL